MNNDKIYGLKDEILFGKYKWKEEIEDIIGFDIDYITYLIEEKAIELDSEAYKCYQNKLKQ